MLVVVICEQAGFVIGVNVMLMLIVENNEVKNVFGIVQCCFDLFILVNI